MDSSIKNEYILSRHNVQLTKAEICDISAKKYVNVFKRKCPLNANFSQSVKIIDTKDAEGYLEVRINITDSNKNKMADISIKVAGYFHAKKDIIEENYKKMLILQVTPQLLPYIRMAVANISIMLNIPPINIPTMDILQSIKKNSKSTAQKLKE